MNRRVEGLPLEMSPSPWNPEGEMPDIELLSPGTALLRLEFAHPDIPAPVLDSVLASEWLSIDKGRMYLEVRNREFLMKSGNPVMIVDFDDCMMSTTRWHAQEYELVSQCSSLCARQVEISPQQARSVYEMSKILIPGKVEYEPRYTPRLNLILLTHVANQLSMGIAPEVVWQHITQVRDAIVERVARLGEAELGFMRIDEEILRLFQDNSPAQYLHARFIAALHQNDATEAHFIVTRGKPEGLLGQAYKLHASGALALPFDGVLYTNDIKAEALVQLSRMVPWMSRSSIMIYDDNPNEVLPYLQFIRERNINNMTIVHVRHADSKRRDLVVEGHTPIKTVTDEGTGTCFDQYHPDASS